MRGLKNTQIAGTVLTRLAAASPKASNRPIDTPPGSRGAGPGPSREPDGWYGSPKRIDPVTPTVNASQCFPEKGKEKLCSATSGSVIFRPRSASHSSGKFSTRYPSRAGVKRRVCRSRSKSFSRPSTPSSNSSKIRFPMTETLPMGLPGSPRSCAYAPAAVRRQIKKRGSWKRRALSLTRALPRNKVSLTYTARRSAREAGSPRKAWKRLPAGTSAKEIDGSLTLRAGSVRSRRASSAADRVAVDNEFNTPIALAAFRCVIRSDRLRLAETAGGDGRTGDALLGKKIAHGVGAALGELLIEFVAADTVRMTFDLKGQARMRQQDAGDFCQLLASAGLEREAAGVKEHIGHVHDQAASGVARLQNGIQLSEKLCAELGFFGLGFGGSLARFFGVGFSGGFVASGLLCGSLCSGFFASRFLRFGFGGLLLR